MNRLRELFDEEFGFQEQQPQQTAVLEPPQPQQPSKLSMLFDSEYVSADAPEVTENKAKAIFDPEGIGYDYEMAGQAGLRQDETGHWGSLDPRTGMVLKGMGHKTIQKTIDVERELGNEIIKRPDGRYYSQPTAKPTMPIPEDYEYISKYGLRDTEVGPVAETFGRGAELVGRGGQQFVNRLILDTVESWRPSSLYTKGSRINAARMKNYRELGGQWEELPIGDKVTKFPQYLWADIRALYGNESRAKQAIAQAKLQKKRGAYKIQLPQPEGVVEKGLDIVAGLSAFITKLWLLKKAGTGTGVIPKQSITGDMAVWEALGLAEQDIPGKMAGVRGALGAIGKTPTGSLGGKVAKTGAESALFAGVTAATGGSVEDIIVASLVPVAFNAWGFAKQRQHITQYEQNLKSKALAAHQKRMKEGVSRAWSEMSLKNDTHKIKIAVARAKQAIYHDDAFAPTKDKWEMQRQKALKMIATGKPKQVQRGNDILNFLELKPAHLPPEPIEKQIQEARQAGKAVRGEKFKPPTAKPAPTERPVVPKVGVKPEKGIKLPPKPTQAEIVAERAKKAAVPSPIVFDPGHALYKKHPARYEPAFQHLETGKIYKTGAVHDWNKLPKIIQEEIKNRPTVLVVDEGGFVDLETGEYLTRQQTADRIKEAEAKLAPKVAPVAEGKRPIEMTRDEFIKAHRGQFSHFEGKRRLRVISSDDVSTWAVPKENQRYGKLTKPTDEVLGDIFDRHIAPQQGKPSFAEQLKKDLEALERKPAKEAWEMTKAEATKTTGNLYYSPFKDLINLEDRYRSRQIPKQKVRDAEKLFDAINKGDIDTVLQIEKKYYKAATKGDGWGVGPKPHPRVDIVSRLIGKMAMQGRGTLEQHKEAVKQALKQGKPVPREVLEEYKGESWAKQALKEKPTEKKFYTSVPEEWREHPVLADWGDKGLRGVKKGEAPIKAKGQRPRKTFIWADEFEKIPTRLPKATMDAFRAKAGDEIWYVTNRKKGVENHYLVPKQVVAEVREELGEAAFVRKPKPVPTQKQVLQYAIQSANVKGDVHPGEVIERALADEDIGITEAELTDNQKRILEEYRRDYEQDRQEVLRDIQERATEKVRAAEAEAEIADERKATREAEVAGEIGEQLDKVLEEDFLEGIAKGEEETPTAKKKQPTDLIGRPILKGGASGKQLALGIYADKVPPTDVPTKVALQNAVATALNDDYKKVRATKKKYKGVKDEKQLYEKHNFPNKLFIHPENPYPEMRAAWTIATKGKGLFGGEVKRAGGAAGASVAAVTIESSGYGTIAPSEKSTFAKETQPHRVAQALPDKTKINVLDELLKIASPAHRVGSREGARVLRKNLGKLAQETVVAHKTLRKIHHAFTFMNRDDIYDFIDRLENGQEQLSPRLTQVAAKFRSMLDERRDAVQALGKGQLENFYENYFPHIWKDPKAAEKAIRQIFGKRRFEGSKSFLKKRTIMTIKEGREAGLELVSENPVDLVLLKLFEMDRYLMAHHVIQDLKSRSLIKFVYSRSPSPEGYKKIDDRAFTVYMPPEITKKEAYDSIMVDQMMDIARSLGIDAQRFVSLGKGKGRWWGYAQIKEDKVRTRYAGPEGVLTHEIGHVLNSPHRYNVYEILRRAKEGGYKDITRGKHKGEQKFVPTEEAVKHRKTIDAEWRALADARYKDQSVTQGFKKYVRKTREKEAVMLEALIHAPEEFKRVAPTLHGLFVKFLNAHSELRPILDIKPSLVLGSSEARIPVPGFTVLGHYYAPEPVAKILNNYLSPGLRNNENVLIASGYNMARGMANIINQAQLSLSLFHAINVTTDMMASTLGQGIRRLTVKGQMIKGIGDIISTPISPILRLWDGVRLRMAYSKQIDTIEDENLQNMVKAVVLADGRDRMDPFYYNRQIKALQKTISDILTGSPIQKIKGVGKLPFNTFGATLEALAAPLMQWYVPTGKLGLFAMLAQHEMQRAGAGQINAEQLHERLISSWDSVDNRMGQLVYDNLFWNKTLKDVAMLAVRSVGWNLGSWREYGGVPVDILGTKGRLERGDVLLSQKMAYTIGAVILYATLGAVTMYLLTGKAPEEPKDYLFPKTGRKNPDGSDERISFPTYAKDWWAYGTQPVKTVTHKIHPLWGLLTDLATNKDFFDVEVRHPDDPISQQMLDFAKHIGKAFITISIRNYMKMQKTAPESKKKNFWVSITGVVSAPSYITRSPAQKLMYQYIIERIPDKARTKESFEKSLYRKQLKNRLRKGEPIDEKEAIRILGRTSFKRMKTDARKEPFAESFNRLTLYEALNVYAVASKIEREQVKVILSSKYRRARNITDDMKTMYKELIK